MQFFLYLAYSLCLVCRGIQKSTLEDQQPFTYLKAEYKIDGVIKSLPDFNIKVNSLPCFYTTVVKGNLPVSYPEKSTLTLSFYSDPDFKSVANNSTYEVKFTKTLSLLSPVGTDSSASLELEILNPTKSFCIELTQVPFMGLTTGRTESGDCLINITSPILTTAPEEEFTINELYGKVVTVARFQGGVILYSDFLWKMAKKAIECCFYKALMGCTPKIKSGIEKIQCYLKGEKLRKILAELARSCFMQKDQKCMPICPPKPFPCPPKPCPCPPQPPAPCPAPCPAPYPVYPSYGRRLSLQDGCSRIVNLCQSDHPLAGQLAMMPCSPHGGYVYRVNAAIGLGSGGQAYGLAYPGSRGYTPALEKKDASLLKEKSKKEKAEEESQKSDEEAEKKKPKKMMSTTTVVLVACGGFVGVVAVGVAVYYFI